MTEGLRYRRALLKLSGELVAGDQGFGISWRAVEELCREVVAVHRAGVTLGLVVGGGNIVRGAEAAAQGVDRVSADYMGMLATVINALAIQDILEKQGVETRVLTAIRMEELAEPYIRRRALRHLEKGRVVLFAGGTGNPYFSTDTAAVLRAIEIGADVIVKGTKVDGVYAADPVRYPGARRIERISFLEVMTRELAVMDGTAVSLCKENNLPIIVLNVRTPGAVLAALRGEPVGTLVTGEGGS